MYRQNARKDYLNLAKSKKRTAKRIRKAIRKQLQYIRRDLGYLDDFINRNDVVLSENHQKRHEIIRKMYEQQR